MNKYIKFSVPIIMSLSLFVGTFVYAADTTSTVNIQIQDQMQANRAEIKAQLQTTIANIKAKRQEFQSELTASKEQAKQAIATAKAQFQASIAKIKDLKKQTATENIITTITDLNTTLTTQFSNKINQIENVLVSANSRISKAEARGIDVSTAKAQALKAETAIDVARATILAQSKKSYTPTAVDETKLKAEMQTIRDTFKADIKATFATVKLAHQAVKDTATTLAKIPKIDDDSVGTPANSTN